MLIGRRDYNLEPIPDSGRVPLGTKSAAPLQQKPVQATDRFSQFGITFREGKDSFSRRSGPVEGASLIRDKEYMIIEIVGSQGKVYKDAKRVPFKSQVKIKNLYFGENSEIKVDLTKGNYVYILLDDASVEQEGPAKELAPQSRPDLSERISKAKARSSFHTMTDTFNETIRRPDEELNKTDPDATIRENLSGGKPFTVTQGRNRIADETVALINNYYKGREMIVNAPTQGLNDRTVRLKQAENEGLWAVGDFISFGVDEVTVSPVQVQTKADTSPGTESVLTKMMTSRPGGSDTSLQTESSSMPAGEETDLKLLKSGAAIKLQNGKMYSEQFTSEVTNYLSKKRIIISQGIIRDQECICSGVGINGDRYFSSMFIEEKRPFYLSNGDITLKVID